MDGDFSTTFYVITASSPLPQPSPRAEVPWTKERLTVVVSTQSGVLIAPLEVDLQAEFQSFSDEAHRARCGPISYHSNMAVQDDAFDELVEWSEDVFGTPTRASTGARCIILPVPQSWGARRFLPGSSIMSMPLMIPGHSPKPAYFRMTRNNVALD
jgi:hypothetical protein